jgi:hypothetical protein
LYAKISKSGGYNVVGILSISILISGSSVSVAMNSTPGNGKLGVACSGWVCRVDDGKESALILALLRVWWMMMTQTIEVPTTQQTTAIIIIPIVADSSSLSPDARDVGITVNMVESLSTPRGLDISHSYRPASDVFV